MGCDIHTNVEVRQPDGSWKSHQEWSQEDSYMSPKDELMDSRNYDLFAILADVRNGRGFAGIVTGQGFVPMATPRGVPDDASPEYKAWVEQWDGDGHSHSYFTVAEIMAYDWTQTSKKTGCVSLQEWSHYKVNGKPESWSGSVSGGGIKHVKLEQVEDALARIEADLVLVEGAGGLLVQFDDLDGWTLADLAVELDAPVVLVVAAGLGTLNKGQRVRYEVETDRRNKQSAVNLAAA